MTGYRPETRGLGAEPIQRVIRERDGPVGVGGAVTELLKGVPHYRITKRFWRTRRPAPVARP
jgi:hypothetical protein